MKSVHVFVLDISSKPRHLIIHRLRPAGLSVGPKKLRQVWPMEQRSQAISSPIMLGSGRPWAGWTISTPWDSVGSPSHEEGSHQGGVHWSHK